MVEITFFIILLLNTTGLFRFIAPVLHISISTVSIVLLVLQCLYIVFHYKEFANLVPKILPWLGMLIIWPVATLIYAPEIEIRQLGLLFYGFTLFAGSAIYISVNDWRLIHLLFGISLGITILGELLNFTSPALFESTASLAHARIFHGIRPGGFFLQPNLLGIGLVILFQGWLVFTKRGTVFAEPGIFSIFFLSLIVTGSRTGFILGLITYLIHLGYEWYKHFFHHNQVNNIEFRLLILVIIVIVGVIGVNLIWDSASQQVSIQVGRLYERFSSLFVFTVKDFVQFVTEDNSIIHRTTIQREYWQWIGKKPLFGYGQGAGVFFLKQGEFDLSPHSTLISQGFDYGILYPVVMIGLLISLMFNRRRVDLENFLGTNAITQFVIMSGLLYLGSGELFQRREYMVALGVMFAALNFPKPVNREKDKRSMLNFPDTGKKE